MRVLVVEDETKMRDVLQRGLEAAGYAVEAAADGEEGLARVAAGDHDAIVLDIKLPGIDGFEVCRQLRRAEVWTPVLMLTARGDIDDRINGLDAGADDYLVKPFAFGELLSRMRALIRRGRPPRPTALECGPLVLEPATRHVTWDGAPVELSTREFALLEFLLHHPGDVDQRFAGDAAIVQAVAAESFLVDQQHARPERPRQPRRREAAGPAADDGEVVVVARHADSSTC